MIVAALTGAAEQVVRDAVGIEFERVEDVEDVLQGVLGQRLLVRPLPAAEDAGERVEVRLLDAVEDPLEAGADVLLQLLHVLPRAALGDEEPVVIGKRREFLVAVELLQGPLALPVIGVGDPLEEEQREDVRLEVGGVHRAAKCVRGVEKLAVEFGLGVHRLRAVLRSRWGCRGSWHLLRIRAPGSPSSRSALGPDGTDSRNTVSAATSRSRPTTDSISRVVTRALRETLLRTASAIAVRTTGDRLDRRTRSSWIREGPQLRRSGR
jgi:hypothetical protein